MTALPGTTDGQRNETETVPKPREGNGTSNQSGGGGEEGDDGGREEDGRRNKEPRNQKSGKSTERQTGNTHRIDSTAPKRHVEPSHLTPRVCQAQPCFHFSGTAAKTSLARSSISTMERFPPRAMATISCNTADSSAWPKLASHLAVSSSPLRASANLSDSGLVLKISRNRSGQPSAPCSDGSCPSSS